ncbi:unnamed protein product [Chrysoparadoxa australica]
MLLSLAFAFKPLCFLLACSVSGGFSFNMGSTAPPALQEYALGWTSVNGLAVGVKSEQDGSSPPLWTTSHIPFSLLPNRLPPQAFAHAQELAPLFNKLVDRISRDKAWLTSVLADAGAGDPFTAQLLRIYEEEKEVAQPLALGILRSDYMLHDAKDGSEPCLLQVELNTIASSFGCLSAKTTSLHRHLIDRFGDDPELGPFLRSHLKSLGLEGVEGDDAAALAKRLPDNPTLEVLPRGLAAAHKAFGSGGEVVLFVVQPGDSAHSTSHNLSHSSLQHLWENHRVPVMRISLAEIEKEGSIDEKGSGPLAPGRVVSVVYYRAGYTPDDYPTDAEWRARSKVESSTAVKCPNIAYHLAGTKKVQQVLAIPGELEKFLTQPEADVVRKCFAGLWSVGEEDGPAAAAAAEAAMADPTGYVLKPQREGGGNNLYGEELIKKLKEASPQELRSYILMQRIFPNRQPGMLLNRGQIRQGETLSELGIYSTVLGDGSSDELLVSEYGGALVRTKMEGVDEGGVATGYAVLSSIIL